jgi:hypothetical protein
MGLALLSNRLNLGEVLETVRVAFGGYDLLAHWTQGEFHHDLVVRVAERKSLPGPVLVISTNCNGGVKEIICLLDVPERDALWHARCPTGDFAALELPIVLDRIRTIHYFDPCELLGFDARSELKPEFRRRQRGGGWEPTY